MGDYDCTVAELLDYFKSINAVSKVADLAKLTDEYKTAKEDTRRLTKEVYVRYIYDNGKKKECVQEKHGYTDIAADIRHLEISYGKGKIFATHAERLALKEV